MLFFFEMVKNRFSGSYTFYISNVSYASTEAWILGFLEKDDECLKFTVYLTFYGKSPNLGEYVLYLDFPNSTSAKNLLDFRSWRVTKKTL